MSDTTLTTKRNVRVKIPTVPNFIQVNGHPEPVSSFSENELQIIGTLWTKDLIAKAKRKKSPNDEAAG